MNAVLTGDSRKILRKIDHESIDLVYLDPPFFTQKEHTLKDKNREKNIPSAINGMIWTSIFR